MSKLMKFLALTAVLGCCLPTTVTANLGEWGEWGEVELCPNGQVAYGFSLKTQIEDEDGALNSISLKCTGGKWIYSAQGSSGKWGKQFKCPGMGSLRASQLRVGTKEGEDVTVVKNLKVFCYPNYDQDSEMRGDGISSGDWKTMELCEYGIVGLQTRLVNNNAVNNVLFICSEWRPNWWDR